MKRLEPPDTHHLAAAEGWLELGNPGEAELEIRQISAGQRSHPDVAGLRWKLLAEAGRWAECVAEAAALVEAVPGRVDGWIHRSYALHELKRTREAYDLLLPAAGRFLDNWLMRFNLACYACQMGRLAEAMDWLKDAARLGDHKAIKLMALDDPDLEPLRKAIGEM